MTTVKENLLDVPLLAGLLILVDFAIAKASAMIINSFLLAKAQKASSRHSGMKRTSPFFYGLLLLAAPAAVQAQFNISTNGDNTITITQYTGTGGAVAIPATTNGLTVTIIGHGAFSEVFGNSGGSLITDVTIPFGVASIESNAFQMCDNLSSVAIPGSVTNIGYEAFFECAGLASLTIPGSVTSIGENAFAICSSLTNVMIDSGVTSIGYGAFNFCISLANVTIPGSVTNIAEAAFEYCTSLTNLTIVNGVPAIGQAVFFACTSLANVTIPGSVTNLGLVAFGYCTNLTSVTIPAGVISIGGGAFEQCVSLTNVTIPSTVTSIGSSAFLICTALTSITIPGSVTNIGYEAFYDCMNLMSVYFTGDAPALGLNVFLADNNVTVYNLPYTGGWSPPFGGLSPVLWNPVIQTGDGSFGLQNNQFGFNITGTANIPIVVEACTNLADPVWTSLQSLQLTNGLFHFTEPVQTNSPGQFYRLRSQ